MGTLFLHQLADHLKSLRVQLILVVVALLFAANGAVYVSKYVRLADLASATRQDVERRYDVHDLNGLVKSQLRLLDERLPTEFVTEGGANWFGDSFKTEVRTGGDFDFRPASRATNHWVRRYEFVDWTFLVRLVVSFLCIVLAYDSISGEREAGTLRLILANPVARWRLLLSKVAAHLCVVLGAVVVGALFSLLVLSLAGAVPLTASLAGDVTLFLAGTAVYAALFLFVATGVSSLARGSGAALIFLVLVWAVVVVVVPQTSYLVAVRTVAVDPAWKNALADHVAEVEQALASQGVEPRPLAEAARDGYAQEQRYLQQLEEAEDEGFARLQEGFRRAVAQYRVARTVNMVSPGMAFQYSVEALLRTGLSKYLYFEPQAVRYREDLRDFIRGRDAADPASSHLTFLPGFLSRQALAAGDIPRFHEARLPLGRSLQLIWAPLALLLGETLAAFVFALWAMTRLELSRD